MVGVGVPAERENNAVEINPVTPPPFGVVVESARGGADAPSTATALESSADDEEDGGGPS